MTPHDLTTTIETLRAELASIHERDPGAVIVSVHVGDGEIRILFAEPPSTLIPPDSEAVWHDHGGWRHWTYRAGPHVVYTWAVEHRSHGVGVVG